VLPANEDPHRVE